MEVNATALLLAALLLLPSWAAWARLRNDGGPAGPASTPGGLPDLTSASRKRRGKRKRGGKKADLAADDVQEEEEEGVAEEEVHRNGAAGDGDRTAASVTVHEAEKEDGASTPDEVGSASRSQRKKGNRTAYDPERADGPPGGAWKEPPPRQLSAASGVIAVTGRGSGRRKPQKAPSLADFPALSASPAPARNPTNAATRNTQGYSGKGSSDDEDSSRPEPGGGIRHPNDTEVDDEGGAPVRVIKLTDEGEEEDDKVDPEQRRREAAEGWIKVPKAPSAPRTLRITSSKSSSSPPLRTAVSYGGGAQEETKKQRENRRRAERKKEEKEAERKLQEARLRAHRQEVTATRIKDLAKEDAKRKLSAASKSRSDSYNELLWD